MIEVKVEGAEKEYDAQKRKKGVKKKRGGVYEEE